MKRGTPSDDELIASGSASELLDVMWEDKLREKAQIHMEDSVDTLVALRKKSKSDAIKRQCANDLIGYGHKHKDANLLDGLLDDGKLKIQVNLIQFEASEHGREVVRRNTQDAIDVVPVTPFEPDPVEVLEEEVSDLVVAKPKEMDPLLDLVITNPGDKT